MKINSNAIRTSMCVLAIGLSAGSFYTVMAHQPETAEAQSAAAVPGGQVDLTYAAEKALPAVVHIRFVQNSKVTTAIPVAATASARYRLRSVREPVRVLSYPPTAIS